MIINSIISMLIGYAFGCIQSAYLIGRVVGKMDIREHGSGNAGASNVTTIMGVKYGAMVGVIDILKGTLAVLVVKALFPESPQLAFLSGLMAIMGHMFPVFLHFRGGKGVATLIGMMAGVNVLLGVLFALLVIVPAAIADYIVFGSLTSFVGLPIVTFFNHFSLWVLIFSLALTAVVFFLHRKNLQRVFAGEETTIRSVLFKKA